MAIFNTVPPLAAGAGMKFDGERISTAAAPRNLLDNSDFRNPVNQRGQSSYTKNGYTIDRWAVWDGQLNIGDGFISVKNAYQLLQIDTNKVYTLAAKTAAGVVCFAAKPDVGGGASLGNLQISMSVQNSFVQVLLTNATGNPLGGAYWAALYEGEYNAETLPEYQPKGYATELAECCLYYQKLEGENWGVGAYPHGSGHILIPLAAKYPMRTINISAAGSVDAFAKQGWQGAKTPFIQTVATGYVARIETQSGYEFGNTCLVKGSIELIADL